MPKRVEACECNPKRCEQRAKFLFPKLIRRERTLPPICKQETEIVRAIKSRHQKSQIVDNLHHVTFQQAIGYLFGASSPPLNQCCLGTPSLAPEMVCLLARQVSRKACGDDAKSSFSTFVHIVFLRGVNYGKSGGPPRSRQKPSRYIDPLLSAEGP